MSPAGKQRLFFAVSVPPLLLARLEEATSRLRDRWPQARWAPPANQHVTLRFLGWVEDEEVEPVRRAGAAAAESLEPAPVSLSGLGVFPSRARARVLWVGLDDPAALLASAAATLAERLEPLGFAPEERAFRPHLTLARFRTPERVRVELEPLDLGDESLFEVAAIELFRSHLHPQGARYEVVAAFPLGRG